MRYSWDQTDSLIRDVEFRALGTRKEALIYAHETADPQQLSALTNTLRSSGFTVVPDTHNGAALLRVENLTEDTGLLGSLAHAGAVRGEARQSLTEAEQKAPPGFADRFKKNAVRSAGYAYVLGDALMVLAGLVRMRGLEGEARKGGMAELATGGLWFAPNVALAAFGKKNPEMQTGLLMRQVKDYLDKQGVEIPTEDALTLDHLSRKDGPLARIVEFFYEHPIEINNTMEATGGLMMMKGGYEQKVGLPNQTQANPFKMAAGAFVFSSMGASVVMKEKPEPAPGEAADQGILARFAAKPLRIAGVGAMMNNLLNIVGAAMWEGPRVRKFQQEEYLPEKARLTAVMDATDSANWEAKAAAATDLAALEKQNVIAGNYGVAAKLNLVTAATFILANGMYAMASKDTGADIKALGGLDRVYAVTAHVIAAQPKEHQPELIHRMAGFLSAQNDVKDSAEEIASALREKVQGLQQHPWTARVRPATSPQQPGQPSL